MAQTKKTAGKTAQENGNGAKFAAVFNNAKTEAEGKKILDYMIAGFTEAFKAKFAPKTTPARTKASPMPSKKEIAAAVPEAQAETKPAKAEVTPIKESDKKAIEKLHLEFHDYSEKSFAIVGDTKPIKAIMEKYKGRFNQAGIVYFYTLIDDAVARVMKSKGGFIWACKKYEADVKAALCLS